MLDTIFKSGVLGTQNLVASYSAQDFESMPVGPITPFNYDFQSGQVTLGFALVTDSPNLLNGFSGEDFELLAIGAINQLPNTLGSTSAIPEVFLNVGVITPQVVQYASDDYEVYPIGTINLLNNMFEGGGDVFLKSGAIYPHFGGFV